MRILFLSNFYPPHSQGGYEQLCQEVAHLLAARGHTLCVLTGRTKGVPNVEEDGPVNVHRRLELELEGGLGHTIARLAFGGREASERRNVATVERVIDEFRPDVALIWGMWNVPRVVPKTVERLLSGHLAYFLCDYWPTLPNAYIQRLREPARSKLGHPVKSLLSELWLSKLLAEPTIPLAYCYGAFVSNAVRNYMVVKGIRFEQEAIIHLGISPEDFIAGPNRTPSSSFRLVYIGRLSPDKGVHTAIEALNQLRENERVTFHLDIYGAGPADYTADLHKLVERGLPVKFHGAIPRSQLLSKLPDFDVLIFPSEWPEPFAHVILEAMAAGLAVIGTTTGGTGEVLVEGETGLTFQPGDAVDLARQIIRLAGDPALRERLAAAGQAVVLREFDIRSTVDQLEALLYRVFAEHERQTA